MKKEELELHFEKVYFSEGRHEKKIIEALPSIIPENTDIFFDIGASAGQYTYFVNKILKGKKIIAVEADPLRYEVLNTNCAKWSRESSNEITAMHSAIHELDNKSVEFHITNSDISGSLFLNRHIADKKIETIKVNTISIIKLLEHVSDENIFIKMDVEGAEFSAFRSAYKSLKKYNVTFFMEIHGWKDEATGLYPWDLFRFLAKAQFSAKYFRKHFIITKSKNKSIPIIINTFWGLVFFINYLIRYRFNG